MSILNSTYNSFIFNFTKNFITPSISDRWDPYVKRIPLPYDTVTHFLNSTIQAVDFPPVSMDTVQQMIKFKEKDFKNSKDPIDLLTRELTVTFKTTEGFANYWIMKEILEDYLDFKNKDLYLEDLYLRMIDQDGHILSTTIFKQIIMTSISGLNLSYADNVPEFKSFDVTFSFNFVKIEVTTGISDRPKESATKEEIKDI